MRVSTGVDMIEVERVDRLLKRHDESALLRIFDEEEVAYCRKRPKWTAQCMAARYAAKEATAKALGVGFGSACAPSEIVLVHTRKGGPSIVLKGEAKRTFDRIGGIEIAVSVSHIREYAIASVVLTKGR